MSFVSGFRARSAPSIFVKAGALLLILAVSACGTTSKLENYDGNVAAGATKIGISEQIYIQDFDSSYTDAKHDAAEMREIGKEFADLIAEKVKETGAFGSVRRVDLDVDHTSLVKPEGATVALVSGTITRYEDGNALARAMIGMGAGSSYFEADVHVTDARTGTKIGEIKADKNSWVLGGLLAATQTAKSYMPGVATRIAQELKASRKSR